MVSGRVGTYRRCMADIGKLLGQNFRAIRRRRNMTQEEFSEKIGMTQGRVSELENAKGWRQVAELADRLEKAGINPMEMFEAAQVSPEAIEIADLAERVDPATRTAVLVLLRGQAARAVAAS